MDDETKQFMIEMSESLHNFHTLINNHIGDYSTKFGRLKQKVEAALISYTETATVRDKALHDKIDGYKWGLILVASFTLISLGGFVALALWAITTLIGGL